MAARPETGWDASLVGGPFHLTSKRLLGPELLDEPPSRVLVYLCPCCAQIGILVVDDPRCQEIELAGGEPFIYKLTSQVVGRQGAVKLATYIFPEDEEQQSPFIDAVMNNRTVAA